MTILFWTALSLVIYTYLGYPLLLVLLSRFRAEPAPVAEPAEFPAVSVIVPFCLEPERVAAKLKTLRQLDYPARKLQIIFVADGDPDITGAAVSACDGVEAVVLPARRGKAAALNAGMARARHRYLLFTDARQEIAPDALKRLVRRILCPGIGAVSGELVQVGNDECARIGLYWRYEKAIRKAESRTGSVPGVTGALYLIRREYCRPLAEDTLLDDVEMPLGALAAHQRVVLETGAEVFDQVAESLGRERARKVRTLCGNFQLLSRNPWLLLPGRNPIWWQFVSHKVARLLVPYALVVLLALPPFIGGPFFSALWAGQVAFYLLALGNLRGWPGCRGGIAAAARLFTELNLAAVLGAWRFFASPVDPRWEKTS